MNYFNLFLPLLLLQWLFPFMLGDVDIKLYNDLETRFHAFRKKQIAHLTPQGINKIWAESKGYVACSSNKHVIDLIRTIYVLRIVWKSLIPLSIMHCDEISFFNIKKIIDSMSIYNDSISFVDVCDRKYEPLLKFGSSPRSIMRGYFCKPVALVLSPYNHNILLDLDLVWFKNPEALFHSTFYLKTGTLFFRERSLLMQTYDAEGKNPVGSIAKLLNNFKHFQIELNTSYVTSQYYNARTNVVSFFWRCLYPYWQSSSSLSSLTGFKFCPSAFQDSSMVLLDKSKHPKMIEVLIELYQRFEASNGDQDIYWVAATIAQEDFSFSPYDAGQYGDCRGVILHFDPDDALEAPPRSDPSAFYLNAEFIVDDKKLQCVGEHVQSVMTQAVLVEYNYSILPHNTCFEKGEREGNCTCEKNPCQPVPDKLQEHILYHQWVRYSMNFYHRHSLHEEEAILDRYHKQLADHNYPTPSLDHNTDPSQLMCLPILKRVYHHLHQMRAPSYTVHSNKRTISSRQLDQKILHEDDCLFMGCPAFPLLLAETREEKWLPSVGLLCDPLLFSAHNHHHRHNKTEKMTFHQIAALSRVPIPFINTPQNFTEDKSLIMCLGGRSIYLLMSKDHKFHEFPNFSTFAKMGFDTGDVMKLTYEQCNLLEFGETLPPN